MGVRLFKFRKYIHNSQYLNDRHNFCHNHWDNFCLQKNINKSNVCVNFSYSKEYCAFIYGKSITVSIDIEKEHKKNLIPLSHNKNTPMQDKKSWVINEAAAKHTKKGIDLILKGASIYFIKKIKKYELWEVNFFTSDKEKPIYVYYRRLNKTIHIAFCL